MKQQEFEKRWKKIEDQLKERGASITPWREAFYDIDHLGCFWYDENGVVGISYKGHTVYFDVCGDIAITVLSTPDEEFDENACHIKHKSGCVALFHNDDAREILVNDDVLRELNEQGRVEWYNNNWINIVIAKDDDGGSWDYISEPEVAGESNLLEAIENNFEAMLDYIDEYLCSQGKE